MTGPRELTHDIGEFIRDLRHNARISLRQLADQAGVSNPYLSQIERGLRKPSAEVLHQIATALRVSTPLMYLRAGLLELTDGQGVPAAIAGDPDLTEPQKQALTQIYETFRRENTRDQKPGVAVASDDGVIQDDAPAFAQDDVRTSAAKKQAPRTARTPRSAAAPAGRPRITKEK